jgi:Sec-independent protein translocase protein TatA
MAPDSLHLVGEAKRLRELARDVRRLASGLALNNDRQRLMSFAEELEREAEALEEEAAQSSTPADRAR